MNQIIKHQPPENLPPSSKFCADCNMVFYAEHLACPGCDKPIPPAPPIPQNLNSVHPVTGKLELIYTGAEVAKLMNCPLFETVERVVLRIPPSAIAKTFIRKGFEQNRQNAAPEQPAEHSNDQLLGRRRLAPAAQGAKRKRRLLTINEAAAFIGYSVSGLRKLISQGIIQPIQFPTARLPNVRKRGGKKLRFRRSQLEAQIDAYLTPNNPQPIARPARKQKRRPQPPALPDKSPPLSKGWDWV